MALLLPVGNGFLLAAKRGNKGRGRSGLKVRVIGLLGFRFIWVNGVVGVIGVMFRVGVRVVIIPCLVLF